MTRRVAPASQAASTDSVLRHPLFELLARHRTVFLAAWGRREELAGPRRMADERAFQPAAMALQETPPHPAPRRFIVVICTLFTVAVVWACLGQIEIVASAQGRIVVSQRSKTIQPLETSVVKAIYVNDGDKVNEGDLLIELDSTMTSADSTRIAEERNAAQSEVMRTQSLRDAMTRGIPPHISAGQLERFDIAGQAEVRAQLQNEWSDITAKLAKLAAEAARKVAEVATAQQSVMKVQAMLPLAQQREKDFKALSEQGFVAGHAGQDRTRERIELERDLATAQARLFETKAALAEAEQGINAGKAEALRNLKDRETAASLKFRQLTEERAKAAKRNELTKLTAPVAGTVQQLAAHTSGGVVTPAQALLVLVPEDANVTAEVVLDNKDVGFVRQGQTASIKLETFPYNRYGTVEADVSSISADSIPDEKRGAIFPVSLKLHRATIEIDGSAIKLAPGMNLTAEIKTGTRSVIDYLISPLRQHTDEALHER